MDLIGWACGFLMLWGLHSHQSIRKLPCSAHAALRAGQGEDNVSLGGKGVGV